MAPLHQPLIKDQLRVNLVVAVANPYRADHFRKGIGRIRPKVEFALVSTMDGERQKSSEEGKSELAALLKAKKADKTTLVVSDIGDPPRMIPFESLVPVVKDAGAAFVLLTNREEMVGLDESRRKHVSERGMADPSVLDKVDYIFNFSNDKRVYSMPVKLHQDHMNFRQDTERTILLVEGRPTYYTSYLISLQKISQGLTHILHARSMEEALAIVDVAGNRMAGLISGMKFPWKGELSEEAPLRLVDRARQFDPKMAIILQSGSQRRLEQAKNYGRTFVLDKRDGALLYKLRDIMSNYMGFGDFTFRMPNGEAIGSVKSLKELVELIKIVPGESILHHSSGNNFSNWLSAHLYKDAATKIRPIDSTDAEFIRKSLLEILEPYAKGRHNK